MDHATGPVTHSFGQDPQGSLIYTDTGRFSAHVKRRDRPRFTDPDQLNGTREEVDARFKGCISYYGTHVLHPEDGFVVHQVHGSMFPNWEGREQIRFFELKADRLSLNTPPLLSGGGQAVARLVWEKFSTPADRKALSAHGSQVKARHLTMRPSIISKSPNIATVPRSYGRRTASARAAVRLSLKSLLL